MILEIQPHSMRCPGLTFVEGLSLGVTSVALNFPLQYILPPPLQAAFLPSLSHDASPSSRMLSFYSRLLLPPASRATGRGGGGAPALTSASHPCPTVHGHLPAALVGDTDALTKASLSPWLSDPPRAHPLLPTPLVFFFI